MQSQSTKGYLFLLIVLVLAGLSAWQFNQTQFQYGLDVQGGVRLTYDMQFEPGKEQEQRRNLESIREKVRTVLLNRASQGLGVVEGNVQPQGELSFIVELPGFSDVRRARELIGSTAKIRAMWAKNVNTRNATFREFSPAGRGESESGAPFELFTRAGATEPLKPGTPDYQRMIDGWEEILSGSELVSAGAQITPAGPIPTFTFSGEGARKMEAWSRRVVNQGEQLAFVLDGVVISIAPLKDGAILSDQAIIDGQFSPEYVRSLTTLLNAGALDVRLQETSSSTVDPTIGRQALNQIVFAGLISFGLVSLFLLVYYVFPGVVALVALLLYVLFTMTVLKLFNATFSLAAIAGFILSVGMAVDANILVFERMKEEMREGRSLMTAVELGFKRAFPAILDSNACTILTSTVLMMLGTGPVKGFATTLIVGVAISLFTAITVTRSLLVFLVASGLGANPKLYGLERNWFGEKFEQTADTDPIQIMSKSRRWFLISLVTIVVGVPFMFIGGLRANVEFMGGAEATWVVRQGEAQTIRSVTDGLEEAGFSGSVVKSGNLPDGSKQIFATIPAKSGLNLASEEFRSAIGEASGFNRVPNSLTTVGPTVAARTIQDAILGVILSTSLIVIYLTYRFGTAVGNLRSGFKFSLSAIGALLHDILVVVGVAAIVGYFLKWEISALSITAMLTVIGFSVHDTIVIFDRVRENLRRPIKGETFEHLCDRSVTRSFARSLNTSLTVIGTLIILIIWGTATPDLKFFCLAMLVGILSGTYSSIFNATPILYLWDTWVEKRKGYDATLIAEGFRESARVRAVAAQTAAGASENFGTVKRRDRIRERARKDLDE